MTTFDKIKDMIVDQLDVEADEVTMDANIQEDLGADSLDIVDLIMAVEDEFEVKIDDDYLNYAYPYTGKFNPSYPHDYDGRFAMGRDVVNWANRQFPDDDFEGGNHGFTIDAGRDDGFWDGTLEELGDIILLLKKNLKNQGIKIV